MEGFLSIALAVMFISLCFIYYRLEWSISILSRSIKQHAINTLIIAKLMQVLIDKKIITEEDLKTKTVEK